MSDVAVKGDKKNGWRTQLSEVRVERDGTNEDWCGEQKGEPAGDNRQAR